MISMVLGHTDAKAFMRYIPIKPHEMRFCALGLMESNASRRCSMGYEFKSPFAPDIEGFIGMKVQTGYKEGTYKAILADFDSSRCGISLEMTC
jgi:hypothetical protein